MLHDAVAVPARVAIGLPFPLVRSQDLSVNLMPVNQEAVHLLDMRGTWTILGRVPTSGPSESDSLSIR